MTYLITALDAEARPFIEHYRLKRDSTLPYTLYRNEDLLLLVTQPGKSNAIMAVSALLGYIIPGENDILINIGICGAPLEYGLGEALLVHQIFENSRAYYPDILYPHPWRESAIVCNDLPQAAPYHHPVDMESSSIFLAASKFFKLHRIAFLKIVSDHFNPDSVTKEGVIALMQQHVSSLGTLIECLTSIPRKPDLFTPNERAEIDHLKTFLTKSQGDALEDALAYYRLKSPDRPLILPRGPLPDSKRERNRLHEELVTSLTA